MICFYFVRFIITFKPFFILPLVIHSPWFPSVPLISCCIILIHLHSSSVTVSKSGIRQLYCELPLLVFSDNVYCLSYQRYHTSRTKQLCSQNFKFPSWISVQTEMLKSFDHRICIITHSKILLNSCAASFEQYLVFCTKSFFVAFWKNQCAPYSFMCTFVFAKNNRTSAILSFIVYFLRTSQKPWK